MVHSVTTGVVGPDLGPLSKPRRSKRPSISNKAAVKAFYIMLSFVIVGFYATLTLVGAKHSLHEHNVEVRLNDLKRTTITRLDGETYQHCLIRAKTIVDAQFHGLTFIPSTTFTADTQAWSEEACGALFAPQPPTVRMKTLSAKLIYIKNHLDDFLMRLGIKVTDAIAAAIRGTANLARIKRHNVKNAVKENPTRSSPPSSPPAAERTIHAIQRLPDKLVAHFSSARVNVAVLDLFNLFADSVMNIFAILTIVLAMAALYLIRLDFPSTNGSLRDYIPYINGYTPRQFLTHGRDIPIAIFAYFLAYAFFCIQILPIYLLHDETSPGANDILMVYGLGGMWMVLWSWVLVAREPDATVFEKLDPILSAVGTHLSGSLGPLTALFNVAFIQKWEALKNYFAEWLQCRVDEKLLSDSMIVHLDEDETDLHDNPEDSTQQVEDHVEEDEEAEVNHGINAGADSTTLHMQGNQQSGENQMDDALMQSLLIDSGSESDSSDNSWTSINESELED